MTIREFCSGDEAALRCVFQSSVHNLARGQYSTEQINAWAPLEYDEEQWSQRIRDIHPFIVEVDSEIAGYADVQPSGYIDHFYVSGEWARRGVGSALMSRIHEVARQQGIKELWSNVSLTAQPFFEKNGFVIEERQTVVARGVRMSNARMRKRLLYEVE